MAKNMPVPITIILSVKKTMGNQSVMMSTPFSGRNKKADNAQVA
jgi:hypothetical protein